MAVVTHNANILAARYRQRGAAVQQAVSEELDVQAKLIAGALRLRIAVGAEGQAQQSIVVHDAGPSAKRVAVGAAHGWFIEKGVKPGGKGLPRFEAAGDGSIARWLITKNFRGSGRGSKAYTRIRDALRDRYYGLAAHIRRHGVKAQPFVEPTARELAQPVAAALRRRVLAVLTAPGAAA